MPSHAVSMMLILLAILPSRATSSKRHAHLRRLQDQPNSITTHRLTPHHVRYPNQDLRRRLDRPAQNWTNPHSGGTLTITSDALYQGYGTHYVDLWVGTPPQRQTVIVDTGSSVTAFPCSDCTNCGTGYHTDAYFQEEVSSTFKDVECAECWLGKCTNSPLCEISVSYQEGSSWRAYEVTDLVYSGGPHSEALSISPQSAFRMHFGCQTHLTGLFKTQLADGIMGMEMATTSFWKQMHLTNAILDQQFSLCFSRQPVASKEGTSAGAMTMGGTDTRLHQTSMVFASQPNDQGWYTVRIRGLYLRVGGGERLKSTDPENDAIYKIEGISITEMNNGEVIVDSGTTDTYLSTKLQAPFSQAWKEVTGVDYDNDSHRLTDEQLLALPTILLQLEGWTEEPDDPSAPGLMANLGFDPNSPNDIVVAVPPTHYMEYSLKTKKYTSRLYFSEGHGGVLGANFMMGHDILFDVDNSRLGFSESDCDYASVDA